MRAAAAAVGVSAMTPYRYFAQKADRLSGVWEFVRELAFAYGCAAPLLRNAPPRAQLRALLDAFLHYYETNPDHHRLVYMTDPPRQKQVACGLTMAPVYGERLAIVGAVLADFAREMGADQRHIKLAADVRAAMRLGYWHGTLVNLRYLWSDRAPLRETYIEETVDAVQRCLLHGPRGEPA